MRTFGPVQAVTGLVSAYHRLQIVAARAVTQLEFFRLAPRPVLALANSRSSWVRMSWPQRNLSVRQGRGKSVGGSLGDLNSDGCYLPKRQL